MVYPQIFLDEEFIKLITVSTVTTFEEDELGGDEVVTLE